ncbi:hypothetical protein [Cupriavidus necator]|uniref:hypothetical protein n=1 Tax=Cupriavidus necator TaxID=106590 RepID=UPI00339D456A
MLTWDLQETRTLVRQQFGHDQLELARQSLGSAIDRGEYARFHYREATKILDKKVEAIPSERRLIAMFGAGTEKEQRDFDDAINRTSAHVTACVQSLHAISDIFAHAIYYSLGYNLQEGAPTPRRISAHSVIRLLQSRRQKSALVYQLNLLVKHEHYSYLNALANHCKHRSLVKPSLWLDMTEVDPKPFRLNFQRFEYDGTLYEEREVFPFLECAFNRISEIVLDAGNELNAALRSKLA